MSFNTPTTSKSFLESPRSSKTRLRTPNWSRKEKMALLQLVEKHVHVVNSKRTDAIALAWKNEAWQSIHSEMKDKFKINKNLTQIIKQWRRLKYQVGSPHGSFNKKIQAASPRGTKECDLASKVRQLSETTVESILHDSLEAEKGEINIPARMTTPTRSSREASTGEGDATSSGSVTPLVYGAHLIEQYLLGLRIFQTATMQRAVRTMTRNMASLSQARMVGERGSGAGKGGGGGGAIREAGGAFGKMESAHEDQYFYNMDKDKMQKLKEGLHDEISFHEEQIKRHEEAINRHKKRITEMNHQ
ncbi:uncharacterized protein LOC116431422 isoform X2 [Nomia melanderi]|uniref:uncharacterized protein LOC116431422 isoform X2 n=1 Tax=Nomia melanderi TaxID=2448451 RepID=UPI0013047251|nr:uncharacterized protein LOC116431422 isoform X2 [Nomia melanderi]